MDIQEKAKRVKKVASKQQKKVIYDMQLGDERLFLTYVMPITKTSIDKALRLIVNQVEGDVSQLPEEHEKYARRKGWLRGFE